MDKESEFFEELLKQQYGQEDLVKLKELSSSIEWAKGWPLNDVAFWNAEAFMWGHKISKEKRDLIASELGGLKGRNLDVGCGAYSYVKSVGFDFSSKMLQFNSQCSEKVVGDLEEGLPDSLGNFDSVTAVFVLNYLVELEIALNAIKKVLVYGGEFVVVLSGSGLNEWQKQKQVNDFSFDEWKEVLANVFVVEAYQKGKLWFFKCR